MCLPVQQLEKLPLPNGSISMFETDALFDHTISAAHLLGCEEDATAQIGVQKVAGADIPVRQ